MNKDEKIKDIRKDFVSPCIKGSDRCGKIDCHHCHATALYNAGYRKIADDEIVVKKSEYEKIKSLYDTQKGSIMTSSIGDLPLTVEGLRKSVDEIDRARNAEREAQELCEKYYNEAKDLRRELKKAKQETREILKELKNKLVRFHYFGDEGEIIELIAKDKGIKLE